MNSDHNRRHQPAEMASGTPVRTGSATAKVRLDSGTMMPSDESSTSQERRSAWTRQLVRQLQVAADLLVLVFAFGIAYLLRFDFAVPPGERHNALVQLPLVVLIQLAAVVATGIHSFIWRYIGLAELQVFARAAFFSALPIFLLRLTLSDSFQAWRVPLSIILMDTSLAFGGLLAIRVLRRMLHERVIKKRSQRDAGSRPIRVLVIGAGHAGVSIAREIRSRSDAGMSLVGFLDDDPSKLGSVVQGARILGTCAQIRTTVKEQKVDQVILALPSASRPKIRSIVEDCESIAVEMRIVPALHEILDGSVEISRLRQVEIEDLLGREPVELDEAELRGLLSNKRVMVTGAGGSIGSEMVRQIARFHPRQVILVERSEAALFVVDSEVRSRWPELEFSPVVGDVGDEARMRATFGNHRPDIVFHAAAHKHVPLMEANCAEAIRNNVLNTRRLGTIAGEFDVATFVLVSTDKAVRPTSVMGASKRLAEQVIQSLNRRFATRFLAVRFGNVLGSAGSVVPIFRQQIQGGGPITVTHPEMTRYFMTIPEASQLVLQAAAIGRGGEILVLDMGEPVRIVDLARDMIVLSGLKPDEDIRIVFSGQRPGEKLIEELEATGEAMTRTRHPKIGIGSITDPKQDMDDVVGELEELVSLDLDAEIRQLLANLLPEAALALRRPGSHPDLGAGELRDVIGPPSVEPTDHSKR